MDSFPMIRLELQGMKMAIIRTLSEYQVQLDSEIKQAVEAFCTEANLRDIINDQVTRTLDSVIRSEVEKFFMYGEGRATIAQVVKETLLAKKTFTPLDEV